MKCRREEFAERGEYEAARYRRAEQRMFGEMITAAYAEPKLRRLCPVTSHWILWFSRCTTLPFDRVGASVEPCINDRFLVWTSGRTVFLAETADAREAAAVAAALPEGVSLRG